jgi:glutathione S-transferase
MCQQQTWTTLRTVITYPQPAKKRPRTHGETILKPARTLLLALVLAAMPQACTTPAAQSATEAAAPSIVIYHAEGRRSERVVWMCEELGLPYELKFRRGDVAGSFADIQAVNPGMRVAPTVFYNGELLVESGAILEFLLERHGGGRLVPEVSSPDYASHLRFMHYAEGTLASDAVADYRVARATDGKAPRGNETDGQRAMRFAEDHLAKHSWFGGAQFTAADIMMVFPISYAIRMNVADPAKYPSIAAWQRKVEARPAFQRMLAKARPDGRVSPPPSLTLP